MSKLFVKAQTAVYHRLHRDDRGVTSVEYALLVTLIAVAIIAAVTGLATAISGAFNKAATAVTPAN